MYGEREREKEKKSLFHHQHRHLAVFGLQFCYRRIVDWLRCELLGFVHICVSIILLLAISRAVFNLPDKTKSFLSSSLLLLSLIVIYSYGYGVYDAGVSVSVFTFQMKWSLIGLWMVSVTSGKWNVYQPIQHMFYDWWQQWRRRWLCHIFSFWLDTFSLHSIRQRPQQQQQQQHKNTIDRLWNIGDDPNLLLITFPFNTCWWCVVCLSFNKNRFANESVNHIDRVNKLTGNFSVFFLLADGKLSYYFKRIKEDRTEREGERDSSNEWNRLLWPVEFAACC